MEKAVLKNGMKINYIYKEGQLTSFCIGLEAGANAEENDEFGIAHAVEHMVFKGTKNRTESDINKQCDNIFGFNNAMTNYPYVIYYGSTLNENFKKALDVYADIIINPIFQEQGFYEEMNVIKEELKEWSDDFYQLCEDKLYYNTFTNMRIKERIIGTDQSIEKITLKKLVNFYDKYYNPMNCVISVVSSINKEKVFSLIEEYFGTWIKVGCKAPKVVYNLKSGNIYKDKILGITGAKIQYVFSIHELNFSDVKAFKLFNMLYGEGTSGILYDNIRTQNGLVYEIYTNIKYDKGIKTYNITLGTDKKNVDKCINLIDNSMCNVLKNLKAIYSNEVIQKLGERMKVKLALTCERSVELAKLLTTYSIMYEDKFDIFKEIKGISHINVENIETSTNKTLKNPSIQVLF